MNIRNGIDSLSQVLDTQATNTASTPKSKPASTEALAKDTTHLSSAATQAAQSANDSDVRLDKVASIRSQLESGTYSVSAEDVAKKVIDSITSSQQ
jgi:negative regulator of flagellin synthesis FlgM